MRDHIPCQDRIGADGRVADKLVHIGCDRTRGMYIPVEILQVQRFFLIRCMVKVKSGAFACGNAAKAQLPTELDAIDRHPAACIAIPDTGTGAIAVASYPVKAAGRQ